MKRDISKTDLDITIPDFIAALDEEKKACDKFPSDASDFDYSIMSKKKKYVRKGIQKHIDDLIAIETGIRPESKKNLNSSGLDLPF